MIAAPPLKKSVLRSAAAATPKTLFNHPEPHVFQCLQAINMYVLCISISP